MKSLVRRGLSVGILSLLCAPFILSADTNNPAPNQLSSALAQLSTIEKEIPFKEVILATTHCHVLDFETNNPAHVELHRKILAAAAVAGERAAQQGLVADRANEAGNQLEPFVRAALREAGLPARVPLNASGKAQPAGYPDIEIAGDLPCYIELKTYNASTAYGSQRTFYYSPSKQPKITRDAVHFLLTYQMEKISREGQKTYVPIRWKLMTLEDLTVGVKCEFNQSNRKLYGPESAKAVVAEGNVK